MHHWRDVLFCHAPELFLAGFGQRAKTCHITDASHPHRQAKVANSLMLHSKASELFLAGDCHIELFGQHTKTSHIIDASCPRCQAKVASSLMLHNFTDLHLWYNYRSDASRERWQVASITSL